jgi:hypothetical protein
VIEVRRNFETIGRGDVDDLPKESLHRAGIANEYDTRDKLSFVKPAVDDFTSHRHKNQKLQRMTTERSKPIPLPSGHLPPNRLNTKIINPMDRPGHPVRPRVDTKHQKMSRPTVRISRQACRMAGPDVSLAGRPDRPIINGPKQQARSSRGMRRMSAGVGAGEERSLWLLTAGAKARALSSGCIILRMWVVDFGGLLWKSRLCCCRLALRLCCDLEDSWD